MPRTPTNGIDYTNKDYESFRTMMLNALSVKMPEYTDKRQSDAGVVILELNAQGLDILSYYQDVMANEAFLITEEQRSNALKWCQMLSYIPRSATSSKFKQVFVLSSIQQEDVIIPAGTVVKTKASSAENEIKFETLTDLTIPAGKLGNEMSDGEYLYTVDIVQGSYVSNELVGTSNGTANQTFLLNYSPVILDSVTILINEGNGFESWERVSNFVDSNPLSRHFMVNVNDNDEATVVFGNNIFGKIPSPYVNGIFSNYRIGGGTIGNVGAFKIKILNSPIALVSETFNPETAFEEGQEKETLEEIKINAPIANRTIWGALTLEDFPAVLKINFPIIQHATAYKDESNPDNLNIYVLLKDSATLTDDLKNQMLALFDENSGGRKIVGSDTITITAASIVPINFSCNMVVNDRYSKAAVEAEVTTYLTSYFASGNYPFDTELSLTQLASNIMNPGNMMSGVKSFKFTVPDANIVTPLSGQIYSLGTITYDTTGGIS